MKALSKNPASNKLPSGITESDIGNAISKSGYPLQTIIANLLRPTFSVQEEWSYIDKDTGDLRNIDIMASKILYGLMDFGIQVRPILNLIIECKQSDLPFIFFLSPSNPLNFHFPHICGLRKDTITIETDDDASTWTFPILNALELDQHEFIKNVIPCMSFSKCVGKGNEINLSGGPAFNELILPIFKALDYFKKVEYPASTHIYYDCHLAICIGVLDAPMIGVHISEKRQKLVLVPCVRLYRHITDEDKPFPNKEQLTAIDIVHKDFFLTYIENHVSPFIVEFSNKILKHQEILSSNVSFASGMGEDSWKNIESRLEPRKMKKRINRFSIIGKNIINFMLRRGNQ